MARRQHIALPILAVLLVLLTVSYLFSARSDGATASHGTPQRASSKDDSGSPSPGFSLDLDSMPVSLLDGDSIAPKLENATLKAELGRATWKFMHTVMARFPEKPTPDERRTLETFIYLFSRLYPCGDCARHFRQLLAEYPPQTSSRNAAAGWLCFAHNLVNERLEKPLFDCNNIGDFYDCGCGEEGGKADEGSSKSEKPELELEKD